MNTVITSNYVVGQSIVPTQCVSTFQNHLTAQNLEPLVSIVNQSIVPTQCVSTFQNHLPAQNPEPLVSVVNQSIVDRKGRIQTYSGDTKNGTAHGYGSCCVEGHEYVGDWVNGKREGFGTYTSANKDTYTGEWKAGKMHGQGTYISCDGGRYIGNWVNGQQHGQGAHTDSRGYTYKGGWESGQRHGYGELTSPTGDILAGDWVNGKKEGNGKHTLVNRGVIEAVWLDNRIHGDATWRYTNGEIYVGGLLHYKRHGYGTYAYADGDVFKGEWVHGEWHIGRLTYLTGDFCEGEWGNGKSVLIKAAELTKTLLCASNSVKWGVGANGIFSILYLRSILKMVTKITTNIVLQPVIDALKIAAQNNSSQMIQRLRNNSLTIIQTGWQGHEIAFVFHKNRLLICNRGQGAVISTKARGAVISTKAYDVDLKNLEKIPKLLEEEQNIYELREKFIKEEFLPSLQANNSEQCLEFEEAIATGPQKVGNCWYASCKEAIKGSFALLFLEQGLPLPEAVAKAKELKKLCSSIARLQLLHEYKEKVAERSISPLDHQRLAIIEEKTDKAYEKSKAILGPLLRTEYPWLP